MFFFFIIILSKKAKIFDELKINSDVAPPINSLSHQHNNFGHCQVALKEVFQCLNYTNKKAKHWLIRKLQFKNMKANIIFTHLYPLAIFVAVKFHDIHYAIGLLVDG